jgi:hypothetical protein
MGVYLVEWVERITGFARVQAADEDEAVAKARRGEVVEGSQDSEPGRRLPGSFRVVRRVD